MLADNAHMTAVQDAAGRKPLLLACLQGDTDMAKMLIGEAKADVSGLRGTHIVLAVLVGSSSTRLCDSSAGCL
jgi:ankyrin repeat protein